MDNIDFRVASWKVIHYLPADNGNNKQNICKCMVLGTFIQLTNTQNFRKLIFI